MSREQKWKLEREAAELFIESRNQSNGSHLVLEKHADKPDFTATDKFGREVGIEITHLFYDDQEAKLLLNKSHQPHLSETDSETAIETLNHRLAEKEKKARKYAYDHSMILVVRVASPIFDKAAFNQSKSSINIPQSIFDQMWLLFRDTSGVVGDNLLQLK